MNTILGELGKSPKFVDLEKKVENLKSPIAISGLTDVGMSEILAGLYAFSKKSMLLVTYNEIQAKKIVEDLQCFLDNIVFFPKKEIVSYDYIAESKDLPYERMEALTKIQENKTSIVVTTIEALLQKLPSPETLFHNIIHCKVGSVYSLDEMKHKLVSMGYIRYDLIEGKGQFSIRGDILDIAITETLGVRIEFWGDEIDSIRHFSIASQRSIDTLTKISIYPAHEYILEKSISEIIKKIEERVVSEKQQEILEQDIEQIRVR